MKKYLLILFLMSFIAAAQADYLPVWPFSRGGTGQITQQAAINSLAGATTSGYYLRGSGTNDVMSAIQVADVPTLNQNTTGTAATLTGALSANQLLGSLTAVAPTGQSVPSCSTAASALLWTSGTGFSCNTSITAAAAPASGLTGTTLASGVITSSLTTVGTIGSGVWQGTKIGTVYGGTNLDTSASTGVAQVSSGTWSVSNSLPSGITATTPALHDNSGKATTTAYVIAEIANLKPHAPGFSANYPAIGQQCCYYTIPYSGVIAGWSVAVDTGTATIQTWKVAAGTASPTVSNSISTSGVTNVNTLLESTTVTDFTTTTVTAGDTFAFNISALSGNPTKLTFQLNITAN